MQRGGGVDRWLDHAGGFAVTRRVRAAVRVPELDTRKVLAEVRVKDDLRQQAVLPLAIEEVVELVNGPALIVVGVPNGDKGRVPGPLVRVEPRARLGITPDPVEVQNHFRPPDKQSQVVRCGRLLADLAGLRIFASPAGTHGYCGGPSRPLTKMEMTLR